MGFLYLVAFFYSIFLCESTLTTPKVEIPDGAISGTIYKTVLGREVYAFYGVPYAMPPIGKNRFKFPKPIKPWVGVWNATYPASECLQFNRDTNSIVGEEDCLYLNVYTPKLSPSDLKNRVLPVIVFIHGGAFTYGNGNKYKPDYLFDKNHKLIYVTINYRLGPLGFLSTGDDVVPGNNGLKDQTFALVWIQRNIAYFGGDPLKVTIAGDSAGGVSVHYHYLSPMSTGLFSQGISQSGTALLPRALAKEVPEKSKRLADLVGCPSQCSVQMIKCLRKRPAKQILESIKEFQSRLYIPTIPFGPIVETPGEDRFLTEKPINIIRTGNVANVPWLVSVTKDEILQVFAEKIISNNETLKDIDENWNDIAPYLLDYNYSVPPEIRDEISSAVRYHFFKNETIDAKNSQALFKVIGDRLYTAYVDFTIKEQVKSNRAPVYFYKFNYPGTRNNVNLGISHGADTQYVLKLDDSNPHKIPIDSKMVYLMATIWISFSFSPGVPSVPVCSVKWTPNVNESLKDGGISVLEINNPTNLKMNYVKDTEVFDFWNVTLNEYPVVQ